MTITLTLWQRLNLEGIIRQQRQAAGDDFLTLLDLWKKISVNEETRKLFMANPCSACGIGRSWDMDAIEMAPAVEIDIEKAEARKALALIDAWKQFTVDDGKWLIPLKQALQELKDDASPAAAVTRRSETSHATRRN